MYAAQCLSFLQIKYPETEQLDGGLSEGVWYRIRTTRYMTLGKITCPRRDLPPATQGCTNASTTLMALTQPHVVKEMGH